MEVIVDIIDQHFARNATGRAAFERPDALT